MEDRNRMLGQGVSLKGGTPNKEMCDLVKRLYDPTLLFGFRASLTERSKR